MKKNNRVPLYRKVWFKIRYWQNIKEVQDSELAKYLNVAVRTLRDYDANAKTISLEKVDNFLYMNNMDIEELLSL